MTIKKSRAADDLHLYSFSMQTRANLLLSPKGVGSVAMNALRRSRLALTNEMAAYRILCKTCSNTHGYVRRSSPHAAVATVHRSSIHTDPVEMVPRCGEC